MMPVAERKAAWLEDRRTCITGTDLAGILGLSRYSSPLTVWLDKMGLSEPKEENAAMRWGKRLERSILEAYGEAQGLEMTYADPYTLHRVPGFHLLGASLDGIRPDGAPVDAKNTRKRGSDWGDDGSDVVPVHYAAQISAQCMVQGSEFGDLAVLFSGQDFSSFRIHRDKDAEDTIRERVQSWWTRHMVHGIRPTADGSDACTAYLKSKFARGTEAVKEATPEVMTWIQRRAEADARLKAAKAEKDEAENLIKAYLGEASAIPGVLSWRNNKDSQGFDFEGAWSELTSKMPSTVWQGILDRHLTTKPGARVLRVTAK